LDKHTKIGANEVEGSEGVGSVLGSHGPIVLRDQFLLDPFLVGILVIDDDLDFAL